MKKQFIYLGLGLLMMVLIFGYGSFGGIGGTDDTNVVTGGSPPDILVGEVLSCANTVCPTGYRCEPSSTGTPTCVLKVNNDERPATPTDAETYGNLVINVDNWECGFNPLICLNENRAGERIKTYGSVYIPVAGTYVVETGFENYFVASIGMEASHSACDDSEYYSGSKKYLTKGEHTFEFSVKLPETAGFYRQYAGVFSGCWDEGGKWLTSDWRTKVVR